MSNLLSTNGIQNFYIEGKKVVQITFNGSVVYKIFTPDSVELTGSYNRILKKTIIRATVSDDVARVTVNGVDATKQLASGTQIYSATFKNATKGTTYTVVCYDADGVASENYTITV